MYEAGKGDKQRPTDQAAYASNFDAIFGKKAKEPITQKHEIKYDGHSPHKNEDWYKCTICGAKDWIAHGYGLMSQLNFYDKPCK